MRANETDDFREAIEKEIDSFKSNDIFELAPLENKLKHKLLMHFAWSFKRKRNLIGELIKHKACSHVHGGKKI